MKKQNQALIPLAICRWEKDTVYYILIHYCSYNYLAGESLQWSSNMYFSGYAAH